MAKVDFKLNDTLVRRQRAGQTAGETPPATPRRPGRSVPSAPVQANRPPEARSELPQPPPAPYPGRPRRRPAVQTSVLLPAALWDRLALLAGESGGLATPNRLLIGVLEGHGPRDPGQAVDDLERFLALPGEQSGVGEPWEERNVRLPVELRASLDELRDRLSAAGLSEATRARLIAATLLLRGPQNADEARALMADLRAEAFRRAIAAETSPRADG